MQTWCKEKTLGDKKYRCFFELTLKIMGGKWKPIILYHLAREEVLRFGELRRSIADITERMLTKQLRELERDELVFRKVYREVPPRVEYTLTPIGCSLIPILLEMRKWGVTYEKYMDRNNLFSGPDYEDPSPPEIPRRYCQCAGGISFASDRFK